MHARTRLHCMSLLFSIIAMLFVSNACGTETTQEPQRPATEKKSKPKSSASSWEDDPSQVLPRFTEATRLTGDWIEADSTGAGPRQGARLQFSLDRNTISIPRAGKKGVRYPYVVNTAATPSRLDIFADSSGREIVYRAIYRLNVDRLALRVAPQGRPYPESLSAPDSGSGTTYSLQRVIAALPAMDTPSARDHAMEEIESLIGGIRCRADNIRASRLIMASARAGDPRGKMWLAKCLFFGANGFPKNVKRAQTIAREVVNQIETLAIRGDAHAELLWGNAIEHRLGTDAIEKEKQIRHVEQQEGRYWYEQAMKQGNVQAIFERGANSEITRRRAMEARKYYRLAVEKGHSWARNRIATHLWHGTECREDSTRALAMFRQSAESGCSYAALKVGEILFLKEVTSDAPECLLAHRRAAEAGNPEAAFRLGLIYRRGWVTAEQDEELGWLWIHRAAVMGLPKAQQELVEFESPFVAADYLDTTESARQRRRSPYAVQMAYLRNVFEGGPSLNDYSANRANFHADQSERMRREYFEFRERLNRVVPGLQPLPSHYVPGYFRR